YSRFRLGSPAVSITASTSLVGRPARSTSTIAVLSSAYKSYAGWRWDCTSVARAGPVVRRKSTKRDSERTCTGGLLPELCFRRSQSQRSCRGPYAADAVGCVGTPAPAAGLPGSDGHHRRGRRDRDREGQRGLELRPYPAREPLNGGGALLAGENAGHHESP